MRSVGKFLSLAIAAILVAGAAPNAPVRPVRIIPPPTATAANSSKGARPAIHGRVQTPPPVRRASLAVTPPPAISVNPAQCRQDCARPYYFCLAGQDPDYCPAAWTQCLSACDQPATP